MGGRQYIDINQSIHTYVCTLQTTSSLAVERELRARAEQKEGEEREERVAANAQLLALQQAHAAEVEGMRVRSVAMGRIRSCMPACT